MLFLEMIECLKYVIPKADVNMYIYVVDPDSLFLAPSPLLLYRFEQSQFGECMGVSSIYTRRGKTNIKSSEQNQHKHSAANYVISFHERLIFYQPMNKINSETQKEGLGLVTHQHRWVF